MDILTEFYALRLEYYEKRKGFLVDKLQTELLRLSNRSVSNRFGPDVNSPAYACLQGALYFGSR